MTLRKTYKPPNEECKTCICRDCPRKPGCTIDGDNLVEWCEESPYHYCGDCYMQTCEERAQHEMDEYQIKLF